MTDEHVVIPVTDSGVHQWVRTFDAIACYLMLDFTVERLLELPETHTDIVQFVTDQLGRDIPF